MHLMCCKISWEAAVERWRSRKNLAVLFFDRAKSSDGSVGGAGPRVRVEQAQQEDMQCSSRVRNPRQCCIRYVSAAAVYCAKSNDQG